MRPGPQPPRCVIQECESPPAGPGQVYCAGHLINASNGTATTPPIVEPDDPALLEREAKKAAAQEAEEYAERKRVKVWKTLENGSRVPEEYWTDEELEAIEAKVRTTFVLHSGPPTMTGDEFAERQSKASPSLGPVPPPDPVKEATRQFKRALRGRYGPKAQKLAWALAETLGDAVLP
jgi:hypothetical protein